MTTRRDRVEISNGTGAVEDPGGGSAALEARIVEEERRTLTNRAIAVTALSLGALLVIAVAALIVGLVALNRDIESVSRATPAEDSVGEGALEDGAVTADKLADGSVTDAKLAEGAVTSAAIARGAVTGGKVARNALTGATIRESTLAVVPEAALAGSSAALGGLEPSAYLSGLQLVEATSRAGVEDVRGPIAATCPAGTSVVGGGATIDGAARGVAIVSSAPTGRVAWTASAEAFQPTTTPWRLVVTALCATGGR